MPYSSCLGISTDSDIPVFFKRNISSKAPGKIGCICDMLYTGYGSSYEKSKLISILLNEIGFLPQRILYLECNLAKKKYKSELVVTIYTKRGFPNEYYWISPSSVDETVHGPFKSSIDASLNFERYLRVPTNNKYYPNVIKYRNIRDTKTGISREAFINRITKGTFGSIKKINKS